MCIKPPPPVRVSRPSISFLSEGKEEYCQAGEENLCKYKDQRRTGETWWANTSPFAGLQS